uniref:site-specific DNA-methyltransferase (cytosine-N(4)-specific) n=2 Tax=viral metagenome TaxID=1070528 RepID=A0A6H1ZHS2_9ZZZZ
MSMKKEIELNKIYNEDCLETMKRMPDNFVDMTLTSPPYDNLRDYQGYDFNFEGIAKELFRITKDGGVVVWVVGDATIKGSETGTSFKQALYFKEIGFNLHDTMIYQKSGSSMPSPNRYLACFEYMFVFCKGKLETSNLIMDRANRFRERWGKTRKARNKDGSFGKEYKAKIAPEFGRRYNIWKYTQGGGYGSDDKIAYNHPAIFPEKLAEDHILSWSNEGDIILDPMAGSGTTLKMAKKNNRNYIGIEISQEYIKIARQRLRQEVLF